MIERSSIIRVRDNSGGKKLKTIKIQNFYGRQKGIAGNMIIANVQALRNKRKNKSKVKLKQMVTCLLLHSSSWLRRKDGTHLKFDDNSCCILNRNKKLLGSRIFGTVNKDIRYMKYFRLVLLSKGGF